MTNEKLAFEIYNSYGTCTILSDDNTKVKCDGDCRICVFAQTKEIAKLLAEREVKK